MNCETIENRMLDYLEQKLAAGERAMIESHLAACPACRALTRQLERLDSALLRTVKAPVLSAGFDDRLRQRLQAEAKVLSETERAERKRQFQAEFDAGLAQLRRHVASLAELPGFLGWTLAIALAGWLVMICVPEVLGAFSSKAVGNASQQYLFATVACVVFLTVGLAAAFPQKLRRLWAAP